MRRIALIVLPLLTLFPLRADALTIRDIVELTRAGVGEEILLALIEVDPSVFPIDTATLKMLKNERVSERVIVAMVRSGRSQPAEAETAAPVVIEQPPAPEPQVVVIDHHDAPIVREVPVAVPIYIPFVPRATRRVHVADRVDRVDDIRIDDGRRDDGRRDDGRRDDGRRDDQHTNRSQPVYWGFGGQLRPDAWQPTCVRKDR